MNDPDRPPLSPVVYEQIELLLHQADKEHWPNIKAAEFVDSHGHEKNDKVDERVQQEMVAS